MLAMVISQFGAPWELPVNTACLRGPRSWALAMFGWTTPPAFNVIGLANSTELIVSGIASAYVTIAASYRMKHVCNGSPIQ